MARCGAIGAALILLMSVASLRVAAAADYDRAPAASQLAKEISLLARVVQRESENQSASGQRAVAWTVVNRLRQPELYGRTITSVLQARHQYARPKPLRPNSPAYQTALTAALMAVQGVGKDDSAGATHFVKCDMRRKPAWVAKFRFLIRINSHCFYRKAPHHD
jgi:N-acetylmuramoyl-L-alanine amidase